LQKNQSYILYIAGLIAVLAVIFFATRGQNPADDDANNDDEQAIGQETNQNTNPSLKENQNQNQPQDGILTAQGTLLGSDDLNKGNLMLVSGLQKIYIATKRDFSGLLEKEVTMEANGSLSSFVFLGFKEAGKAAGATTDGEAVGGPESAEEVGMVTASGRLEASDDESRGNYLIISGTTKIYLQSVRDYGSLRGSEVELTARGTLQSFTDARLSKK
jgi:hypothetical protein